MSKRMVGYFTLPLLLLLAMPPRAGWAQNPPEGFAPGPDVIMGNLPSFFQAGSNGTQVGLMMGTDICNNGDVPVNWFRLPETDHPAIPQNLYRLSGGANNDDRFEQIGQSWAMHQFFPLQNNACLFGCTSSPDAAHLGVGCSTADSASINASQTIVGSRAWINPYTGIFPSTSNSHTGHAHDGTTHRILVEGNDLNTLMNQGATYYGEAQLVTPHEYAWCQSHPGQCNMFNNVSYRKFVVTGTTSFAFTPVGATVQMSPALNAWPGATIQTIEPAPGVDGRAFIAYKVTQIGPFEWHYEYAIYNQNLDRGIQFFSVPAGCGIGMAGNLGFHAPLNHPGIANDGTAGDAGYSNVPWSMSVGPTATWSTETFAQNPNANALRWGTLYNFRFDGGPPWLVNATIGFFKTGAPITVSVPGPVPECAPSPTPPAPPTPTPTATPTATIPASPTPFPCQLFGQTFDSVFAPALPPGWSSAFWVTSTTNPDTPPNCAFVDDPAVVSDKDLLSPPIFVVSASASISFRNNYDLEAGGGKFFDGGVLEVSVNGGPFSDVTDPAVGGSFVTGGYTGEISGLSFNPLAGRMAWSGNSGGYINTVVNFGPNLNGQTIRLKFRMGSDSQGAGGGWRIDTMTFSGMCGFSDSTPTPTPSATPTPTAPICGELFIQYFDAVTAPALPEGWSSPFWVTSTTDPDSPPNSAFVDDPAVISDKSLYSPRLVIVSASAGMDFRNNYNLESGGGQFFDGGVLEISSPNINSGAFTDVTDPAVGGSFSSGGYTGQISDDFGSPIGGRQAWSGNSGGYIQTLVNFGPNVNGQTIQLRFRMASDSQGAGVGWRIDTIAFGGICNIFPPTPTPTATPSPTPTPTATPTPTPVPTPPTQALNLSTRMLVETGDRVGIGGFIITGTAPRHVLIRAIGPSLSLFGLPNALADTVLTLHGPTGFTTIMNDNWRDTQEVAILATGIAPTNNLESAIDATLNPGAYTGIVRGKNNTSGEALVEVYNLNPTSGSRLANISTRAFVNTGDNIVIAGFVLGGNPPQAGADRIVVRGLGPSMTAFGIPNPMTDPMLELRNSNGALLIANNDWQDNPAQAAQLTAAGLAPTNNLESGIAMTLPPGAYTALLAGLNNGTGLGLVEVYDLGPP